MEKLYKAILDHTSKYYHHNPSYLGMDQVLNNFFTENRHIIFPNGRDAIYFGIYDNKPLYLCNERIEDMIIRGGLYPNFNYVFIIRYMHNEVTIDQLTEHFYLDRSLTACVLKLYQYYK